MLKYFSSLAIEMHPGWALANNVTVLASGIFDPTQVPVAGNLREYRIFTVLVLLQGSLGSGIYHGEQGILNYTFNPRMEDSTVITSHVTLGTGSDTGDLLFYIRTALG